MNFNLFLQSFKKIQCFLESLLDFIYKRKCIECGCSINGDILCKTCAKTVQNLPCFPQGVVNGYPIYSVFKYEGVIKTLIHNLKFKHNKKCAFYIAQYLYKYLQDTKSINLGNAIIIPIPTHKNNIYKRGYDNIHLIALELSSLCNTNVLSNVLFKIKPTEHQYNLRAKQRRKNLVGSFYLKDFTHNGTIILLDDVVTTSSTLDVVTELFKEKGFENLICLTLAKTCI